MSIEHTRDTRSGMLERMRGYFARCERPAAKGRAEEMAQRKRALDAQIALERLAQAGRITEILTDTQPPANQFL